MGHDKDDAGDPDRQPGDRRRAQDQQPAMGRRPFGCAAHDPARREHQQLGGDQDAEDHGQVVPSQGPQQAQGGFVHASLRPKCAATDYESAGGAIRTNA
ncbi:MAG: hypothetical protein WDN08_05990 [Rhizomicrobium sp.]